MTDTHASAAPASSRLALWAFLALLAGFHLCFGGFFPNANGGLGHDYAYMLPALLAGQYWFSANGPFAVPWFTPAYCGGVPLFADPQSIYYSLAQWLAFGMDPLLAVYVTVLVFASLGYWGCYLLLRRGYQLGVPAAVVGAGLFFFNGFFATRMVIGHFSFHGYMLLPFAALALLTPANGRAGLRPALWAGLIGAYWLYAGMINLVLPALAALLGLVLLYRLRGGALSLPTLVSRGALALGVMVALGAAKLVASLAYLAPYPRSDYLLPGLKSLFDTCVFAFRILFLPSPNVQLELAPQLVNSQFTLGRHELEFGLGPVALALLLWWLILAVRGWFDEVARAARAQRRGERLYVPLALLIALLVLPLLLNTYQADWNAFLKELPIIKSSSNLLRWFALYLPLIAVGCGVIFERIAADQQRTLAGVALGVILLGNLAMDRLGYHNESYKPDVVQEASRALSKSGTPPPVTRVLGELVDQASGTLRGVSVYANEQFTAGASAIGCYNPIFGYRLEHFPLKTLHEGSPTATEDDVLNFKNPACYTYPEANRCAPGDHFRRGEEKALNQLLTWRPYAFNFSTAQQVANVVSLLSLALGVLMLVTGLRRRR